MIVHRLKKYSGRMKKLFEAEFDQIKHGKAEFIDADSFSDIYRLDFPDQDELKEFIEDLIELYNSREEMK